MSDVISTNCDINLAIQKYNRDLLLLILINNGLWDPGPNAFEELAHTER